MPVTEERLKTVVDVWKKIVDVQQHFNDLCLRIRNFALTIFTFVLGAAGYLLKEDVWMTIKTYHLPAAFFLCISSLPILLAFYYMDRYWYHKLLLGAVDQGRLLEDKYKGEFEELGLTNAIGRRSPNVFRFKNRELFKYRSNEKVRLLYAILSASVIIMATGSLFVGKSVPQKLQGVSTEKQSATATISSTTTTTTTRTSTSCEPAITDSGIFNINSTDTATIADSLSRFHK